MLKFLSAIAISLALIITPAFALTGSTGPYIAQAAPAIEQVCNTPEMVYDGFMGIAADNGVSLERVYQSPVESDGSFSEVYWKGGATVFVVIFNSDRCAVDGLEVTLEEFRSVTGVDLA